MNTVLFQHYQTLISLLCAKPNTLVLTANLRQSRFLEKLIQAWQQKQACTHFQPFNILNIDTWLIQQYHQAVLLGELEAKLLLNTFQLQRLWQIVLEKNLHESFLINLGASTELAKKAWENLSAWQCSLSEYQAILTPDQSAFLSWLTEFKKIMQKNNWISVFDLPSLLIEHWQEKPPAEAIYLFGFDELTPLYESLFTQLNEKIPVQREEITFHSLIPITASAFPDQETEMWAMATWARTHYLTDPEKRIACIVPTLQTHWQTLRRIFERNFKDIYPSPYNFSSGIPLYQTPIIESAFDLLSTLDEEISIDQATRFLLNPYLTGYETEKFERAKAEKSVRELGINTIRIQALPYVLQGHLHNMPRLKTILANRKNHLNLRKGSASQWAQSFSEYLFSLAFPGETPLSSESYQAWQQFQTTLANFASLDYLEAPFSLDEALNYLKQLTKQHIYQIKTPDQAIQVLGPLEAAGLYFDHIWIMEFQANYFPTPANPNPYLPVYLQKEWQMPHASAERELQFTKQLLTRYQESSQTLQASFALSDGKDPLEPSPLLTSYTESISSCEQMSTILSFENIEDTQGIAINTPQMMKGGTGIFKAQSLCPFKAYATYRLNCQTLQKATLGLSPQTHGNLMHEALQKIMQFYPSSEHLQTLTPAALETQVSDLLNTHQKHLPFYLNTPAYEHALSLEKIRLIAHLKRWHAFELERELRFKVIACEKTQTITVGALSVQMTLDRIDQLENGQWFLIDYKSAKESVLAWFGDFPNAPQLPLYALSQATHTIAGLAFEVIQANSVSFNGLLIEEIPFAKLPLLKEYLKSEVDSATLWRQQLNHWQKRFEYLAEEITQAYAPVLPRHHSACQYCDLTPLCRISVREQPE